MKITKSALHRIIKEELSRNLRENDEGLTFEDELWSVIANKPDDVTSIDVVKQVASILMQYGGEGNMGMAKILEKVAFQLDRDTG
jgi:hypothetical protein